MKFLQLPKNKFLRLLINLLLIFVWFLIYFYIAGLLMFNSLWISFMTLIRIKGLNFVPISICFVPTFFITRYIWFEKSRNRIFYGLFDKFKINFKKFEPRIYTTTSNADELKKYSDLKDQGIITEEEFKAKKKKLLDL